MAGGLFPEYSAYFGDATEIWKRHVIGVTIEAFDEYRDSVCQTLQDAAQASSRPVPDDQAAVNSQEEMFGTVQSVLENAQHLAQQRIADTLAQTFNSPPPILLSPLSNQTIQSNQPGESAIPQAGVISDQNDDSLDVSIKSEVNSSSESECESETDDDEEVQVKDEPNEEEEDIIPVLDENYDYADASSHEQTENTNNSGDHRENSNEGASEHQESNEAMAIDEELSAEEANSEQDGPIIIEVQYTSPPSSPSNTEANDSSAVQQDVSINLNEDIASDDEADHFDAEEDGDSDFGEDQHMDVNNYQHNLENQDSDHDGQDESDHEGGIIDEETDGEDCDSEEQEDMSGIEDNELEDSGDETNNDDEDNDEEEEASLGLAGPSTSAQGRQGTRRVAIRQMVSGKAAKRQRTGRAVVTVPLSIITQKLKCTVLGCKKVVKSKRSMNRHLLSKHQLKEYRCLVRPCHGKVSTSFATQNQLNDHRDLVHGGTTRWTCKCSKKFKSYHELSIHYWRYHELGHFTCSKHDCPINSTTTRAKVLSHQYNHFEAKYECPVDGCDRSFKQKSNLDQHLITHSGERPFPCPECDKSFNRKDNLTTHLRMHRNDKCFHCTWPQCTYSSSDRSSVIQHIRTAHFKLPRTKKQQLAAGIVDDRNARDFVAKN